MKTLNRATWPRPAVRTPCLFLLPCSCFPDGCGRLFCRPQPGLDRAIHVSLPAKARMLACKEHTPEGSCQPVAERRREQRIEVRVAATRPRFVFPAHRCPPDEL